MLGFKERGCPEMLGRVSWGRCTLEAKDVEEEGESESGARQTIAEGDGKVARERQQE